MSQKNVEQVFVWSITFVTLSLGIALLYPLASSPFLFKEHLQLLVFALVLVGDSFIFFPLFNISNFWRFVAIGLTIVVAK